MAFVLDLGRPSTLDRETLTRLVGGKAANLCVMATGLGLPVPPAFAISTEACRAYLASGWPDDLDEEIDGHLAALERRIGRRFGGPGEPLLLSVRSGAPVSMPGMMDTILDLGLNDSTTAGLAAATGDPAFAADCRRRLEAMYLAIVGVEPPADPRAQLRGAVEAVFRSWTGARARAYREREGLSDEMGTGATVQAMVFGNLDASSATGVAFSRNPATGAPEPYGDVMYRAQGEDVVAGDHRTEPLASLDERLPDVAAELRDHLRRLEAAFGDLCDVEFTIERGRLWLLQVRVGKRSPQAALRIAVDLAEDASSPVDRAEAVRRVLPLLADPPTVVDGRPAAPALTVGLGASPGLASGEIVMSPEAAVASADAGRTVILVRAETSPDDVHGMARAAGILTSRGGLASHAAVVARGWGIPAVVGAADVVPGDGGVTIGARNLPVGARITIDGSTGEVFEGDVVGRRVVVGEAATLLVWARELGIEVPSGGAEVDRAGPMAAPVQSDDGSGSPRSDTPGTTGRVSRDDILRSLLVKGYATPDALAVALGATAASVAAPFEAALSDGLAEPAAGSNRLTAAGRERAQALVAAEREAWGGLAATEALDTFVALDGRMKDLVTAWQTRTVDGLQVLNDHADRPYDAEVLAGLQALHRDATAWLAGCAVGLPRLSRYAERLDGALSRAVGGEGAYVASPRVDSYHGTWFELHEDLLRLAGRSRAEEVAAGRA